MRLEEYLNGRKRRPTHPGELLREDIMPAARLTQTDLAKALKVSRRTISQIVLEQRSITPDIALRLARFFGTSPDLWLGLQRDVDVWEAMQANKGRYNQIKPLKHRAA